ncbi:UDP-N-acetylglucosamine 2-epimerase (non-hydrolyzing) [bacterium]|nr:UDP-N-acetylglucosamine 2-epimerase (non-hydrolyzing) [bacterium]
MTYSIGVIIGTRPEAIKLAPIINTLRSDSRFTTTVIITGQHDTLLHPVLSFFDITPDVQLNVIVPGQSLSQLNSKLLSELDPLVSKYHLNGIIAQGDTTSALAGAMVGFYNKLDVFHVEAGLRTDDLYAPYPEEFNRRVIDEVATAKFAPTPESLNRLIREGKKDHAVNVGNTVIDALFLGLRLIDQRGHQRYHDWYSSIGGSPDRRSILVTTHRRENAGDPLVEICAALKEIASQHPTIDIMLPVHKNPQFYSTIYSELSGIHQIKLLDPLPYDQLLWIMTQSTLVLTDSGGLQEEAPSLNKPVLVMRDVTERPEGVAAGCAALVGTTRFQIVTSVTNLLCNPTHYHSMASASNPYGDGHASDTIISYIATHFLKE